ncbi:MAG: hypothetical protein Q8P41_05885 [Pseudomonadota bacterium]|nr:hypothetical protein [Pseudomonadota bacterium]
MSRLDSLVLTECTAFREPPLAKERRTLRARADIDELTARRNADILVVVVEFTFELVDGDSSASCCDISATFQLRYLLGPDFIDERDFAVNRAVVDAWPYWRTLMAQTMANMGYAPYRLPPSVPPALVRTAHEVFDLGPA